MRGEHRHRCRGGDAWGGGEQTRCDSEHTRCGDEDSGGSAHGTSSLVGRCLITMRRFFGPTAESEKKFPDPAELLCSQPVRWGVVIEDLPRLVDDPVPTGRIVDRHPHHRRARRVSTGGPVELGIPEGKDASV